MEEATAIRSKDRRTYNWSSWTLRIGMYTSFGAMVLGLVWWVADSATNANSSQVAVLPIDRILPELLAGNPLALLNLGVILLLVTPGVTLLTQIVSFIAVRNWRFVAIAACVAGILLLSLAISLKWIKLI